MGKFPQIKLAKLGEWRFKFEKDQNILYFSGLFFFIALKCYFDRIKHLNQKSNIHLIGKYYLTNRIWETLLRSLLFRKRIISKPYLQFSPHITDPTFSKSWFWSLDQFGNIFLQDIYSSSSSSDICFFFSSCLSITIRFSFVRFCVFLIVEN